MFLFVSLHQVPERLARAVRNILIPTDKMAEEISTPINTITRDNITVLIMNNVLNNSVEFNSDCDSMETDSPLRKPCSVPISKKLFHSPMSETPNEYTFTRNSERRKAKKRKQTLIPSSNEKIKKAFVKECDKDGYSPEVRGGMRKKVLISLFHNKEYSMDVS